MTPTPRVWLRLRLQPLTSVLPSRQKNRIKIVFSILKKQQLAYDFGQRTEIVTKNRSQNRRPNSLEIVGLRGWSHHLLMESRPTTKPYRYSTGSTRRTYVPSAAETISNRFSPRCHTKASVILLFFLKTFVRTSTFLLCRRPLRQRSWHPKDLVSRVDSHSLHKGEFSWASRFCWGIRTFIHPSHLHGSHAIPLGLQFIIDGGTFEFLRWISMRFFLFHLTAVSEICHNFQNLSFATSFTSQS